MMIRAPLRALLLTLLLTTFPFECPADYPDPLPDFAHPDAPHSERLSVDGGRGLRPVLVVLVTFSDKETPEFVTPTWHMAAGSRTLALADPYVDFYRFDVNGDGSVDQDELAVVMVRVANPLPPADLDGDGVLEQRNDDGGASRNVFGIGPFDGVEMRMQMALTTTATNRLTINHELGHVSPIRAVRKMLAAMVAASVTPLTWTTRKTVFSTTCGSPGGTARSPT